MQTVVSRCFNCVILHAGNAQLPEIQCTHGPAVLWQQYCIIIGQGRSYIKLSQLFVSSLSDDISGESDVKFLCFKFRFSFIEPWCSYYFSIGINSLSLFHGRHRRPISHHWVWSAISTHNVTRLWPLKCDQFVTLHAHLLATLKSFARGRQNRTNLQTNAYSNPQPQFQYVNNSKMTLTVTLT